MTNRSVVVAPLQFITFINNNKEVVALVDSGAQLNLMDKVILNQLQYVHSSQAIKVLRGVNNSRMQIQSWVQVTMH